MSHRGVLAAILPTSDAAGPELSQGVGNCGHRLRGQCGVAIAPVI